jgi:hypothetical protein
MTSVQRVPRRARYLIPVQTPRRTELVAALCAAAVLAHAVFAQLTLLLVIVFYATTRLTRWRPQWLLVPAAAGLVWALAIGPAAAAARLTAGPRHVLNYFGGSASHPGRILHPAGAFSGLTHWLPGQFPLALMLAAAEAAGLWWLDWLHAADWASGQPRPGLLVAVRRRWTAGLIRSGGVVTADGGCVGVDIATGRPATISWREAEGGVICAGPAGSLDAAAAAGAAGRRGGRPGGGPGSRPGSGLAEMCFLLAHAGIRRRKPVIVIDLTGSGWLAESLTVGCDAAGAPLRWFGADGPGCYEPVRGGDPVQAAALVTGMIDWSGTPDQHRRTCAAYLNDAFAVMAAAPADPGLPVLDDLATLLSPEALRARLGRVPAYHPRRTALADRVVVSVQQAVADPAALSVPGTALAMLRASALGHWLAPGPARISLGQAVRDRAVVTFSLDRAVHDRPASMIASLAAADLVAVCAELGRIGVPGDALAWIHGCEAVDHRTLSDLVAAGPGAGLAVLLSTASAAAAERLAGTVNVVLARGPADPAVAARFAGLASSAGSRTGLADSAGPSAGPTRGGSSGAANGLAPDYPFSLEGNHRVGADFLRNASSAEFALLVKGPRPRVMPLCRSVPGAGPGRRR